MMRRFFFLLNFVYLFILIFLMIGTTARADSTWVETGTVSGTWSENNSPYLIQGDITIPNDSSLTILPRVEVVFLGYYALHVQGRLRALGEPGSMITFTVNDTTGFSDYADSSGAWRGIHFNDTSGENDSSQISYCKLKFGKAVTTEGTPGSGGALNVYNFDKLLINNCHFEYNMAKVGDQYSFHANGGAVSLVFADVVLLNNTFIHNQADEGGAVQCFECNPRFIKNSFMFNRAYNGGAVHINGISSPTFQEDYFYQNHAENNGGGLVFWDGSNVSMTDMMFNQNTANWGGAIADLGGELFMHNSIIEENSASDLSGGIHADFSTLEITDCAFLRNQAQLSGGIHSWYSDLNVSNCLFENNTAASAGAGIHGDYSHISIDSCRFLENQASWGAGVQVYNCDLSIDSCRFENNAAIDGRGGAIDFFADSTIFGRAYQLSIVNSHVSGNTATSQAAGIRIEQGDQPYSLADVKIEACIIEDNHSDVYSPLQIAGEFEEIDVTNTIIKNNTTLRWAAGPGFLGGCSGNVSNCLFVSNFASYSEGQGNMNGAAVGNGSRISFFNCTFTDSSQSPGYGLSVRRNARAYLTNCILWSSGNHPVNLTSIADLGCDVYINYCTVENGVDSLFLSDSLCVVHWGVGNIESDPLFADPHGFDYHLQSMSPCIGAGINCLQLSDQWQCAPVFDMEGNRRPYPQGSECDMGPFEHELGMPTAITGNKLNPPQSFALFQNYPNPFNPMTTIRYTVGAVEDVRANVRAKNLSPIHAPQRIDLSIYNTLGQKVATLLSEQQPAGAYQVEWDASGFPSGVYFYRFSSDQGYQQTRKLILLK